MVAALPVIVGIQLMLNALNYDIQNVPRMPVHTILRSRPSPTQSFHRTDTMSADTSA